MLHRFVGGRSQTPIQQCYDLDRGLVAVFLDARSRPMGIGRSKPAIQVY